MLKAERPLGPLPPTDKRKLQQRQLLSLSVRYPDDQIAIEIPDSEIGSVLPLLRRNIEDAWTLEGSSILIDMILTFRRSSRPQPVRRAV